MRAKIMGGLAAAALALACGGPWVVASATSLPLAAPSLYAGAIGADACTAQVFSGAISALNTLRVSNMPAACAGRKLVVYTLGSALSSTPAYSGVISTSSVSFPVSAGSLLGITGLSVSVDGWPAQVNWLGSLL